MDTRVVTPPDRPDALPEPAVPTPAPDGAQASPLPAPAWTGDDALSEFPAESELRRGRRPVRAGARRARSRSPWSVAAAIAVVALSAAVATWIWWPAAVGGRSWWPARATTPAATGTLAIESSPAGAAVFIDGRERGTTPLTLPLSAGTHEVALSAATGRRVLSVTIAAGAQIVHHVELAGATPTTGRLLISAPAGAPIVLDGTRRGVTPAEIADLPAGEHTVTVGAGSAAVTQRVVVPAGGVASLLVPLAQGGGQSPAWISVVAPVELQVFDGQTLVGNSTTNRILVLAGRHTFNLVNVALGYQATRTVDVEPGRVFTLRVEVPSGVLHVNAVPWAEVFVDGRRVGETPIANLAVPIGAHELTLRNPKFPEQKRPVVISLTGPTHVGVDLRR